MFAQRIRFHHAAAVLSLALGLAGAAHAQSAKNCNPSKIIQGGLDIRDISRNINGVAGVSDNTAVYFYACGNLVSRYASGLPFTLDATNLAACDEQLAQYKQIKLVGAYYSVVRMTDPYQNPNELNTRIGWHFAFGTVIGIDSTGAQTKLGTFNLQGTVGTNTSRQPLAEGMGDCYVCGHHEGLGTLTLNGTPNAAGAAASPTSVLAVYQFDTANANTAPCDQLDPCVVGFEFRGTMDGISVARCGTK